MLICLCCVFVLIWFNLNCFGVVFCLVWCGLMCVVLFVFVLVGVGLLVLLAWSDWPALNWCGVDCLMWFGLVCVVCCVLLFVYCLILIVCFVWLIGSGLV